MTRAWLVAVALALMSCGRPAQPPLGAATLDDVTAVPAANGRLWVRQAWHLAAADGRGAIDTLWVRANSTPATAPEQVDIVAHPAASGADSFAFAMPDSGSTLTGYVCGKNGRFDLLAKKYVVSVDACKSWSYTTPAATPKPPPPPVLDSTKIQDSTGAKLGVRLYIYPRDLAVGTDSIGLATQRAAIDSSSGLLTITGAKGLIASKQYCLGVVLTDSTVELTSMSRARGCSGQGLQVVFGARYDATKLFAVLKPIRWLVEPA